MFLTQTFLIQNLQSNHFPISHSHKKPSNPIRGQKQPNSWPSLSIAHVCLQSQVGLRHLFHIDVVICAEWMWRKMKTERNVQTVGQKSWIPAAAAGRSVTLNACLSACTAVWVFERVHAIKKKKKTVCSARPSEHSWRADIWWEGEKRGTKKKEEGGEKYSGVDCRDKGNLGWNTWI